LNKQPHLGVVYNPSLNVLYYAKKDMGAFVVQNPTLFHSNVGTRIRPLTPLPASLSDALLCTEYGASKDSHILALKLAAILGSINHVRGIRSLGSAAMNMCMVATGHADIYFEAGTHCWDVCAAAVIIQEAGGLVTNITGTDFDILKRDIICCRGSFLQSSDAEAIRINTGNQLTITKKIQEIAAPLNGLYPRD
jgi:myo-inositol-1(or 4)-monophosphatase